MEYLPTLTPKVIKNNPNVGKYSIHGSLGYYIYILYPSIYESGDSHLNGESLHVNKGLRL